jgi:hypothetical protein
MAMSPLRSPARSRAHEAIKAGLMRVRRVRPAILCDLSNATASREDSPHREAGLGSEPL